eukprot:CAMPEP_0172562188 /NCGR_PEP_ID=MMETSP1067-20121228/95926_1 /TAXON_ID=265564 ORGANISM="Thalassiosira punctigera, Strain Tpunct2005C2" /NCGR_SAMPLE_ID=MMETSP1067 /ASSEMBLY_ACC=CAM_ASM_000444 /LENGTH=380 /DNA_ID=CAMNT_0013352371 /DNA_START=21 /DNA_END=1163 /DNA_ORIENTATION=+
MTQTQRFLCLMVALFSWAEKDVNALSAAASATKASPSMLSEADVAKIANGGVAVLPGFVPPDLVERMRADAKKLKAKGAFRPDGLSNYARGNSDQQGFSQASDRQTFRGSGNASQQSWYVEELGDYKTRMGFDDLLGNLRQQLALELNRPTMAAENSKHEITYNWYEPGAKLGRHLDEHHEETKGPKLGWRYPSRRSVTWLVYLNDNWKEAEGGALLCHPRSAHNDDAFVEGGTIGCHEGNLQVGWMDDHAPVYLDAFRETGMTNLYSCKDSSRVYWSKHDFDVPAQPIDFKVFLPKHVQPRFEQISTATKDPRFANASDPVVATVDATNLEVMPAGGTLVLFDSVTMPHSVLEVTGDRQRIAATGWFHEDSQFAFEGIV